MIRNLLLVTLAALTVAAPATAQAPPTADPELAPLERLIGGRWHLGADSYNTFAWGIGGRSVVAEGHFITAEGDKKVSEMTFLFHPGEQRVIGHGVAIDMGVDYFQYQVHFSGDTIILDLNAYGEMAGDNPQRETWTFTDDDHYEWLLMAKDADGLWVRRMGGSYERRDP